MVFSSSVFLFVFLPITLIVYWLWREHIEIQNTWLLFVSVVFYFWGEPTFIFGLIFSSIANWYLGEKIKICIKASKKKILFVLVLTFNLLFFIFFKYLGFFIESLNLVTNIKILNPNIKLPIGISFFTFQVMSYQIDVYKCKSEKKTNLKEFLLYALMFPQLVAGPIVRFEDISTNLRIRKMNYVSYSQGMYRFVVGLSKKVLLADHLAIIAENAYYLMDNSSSSVITAWIGAIAYYLQLYYDFSGYSDMAIGLGKMFGFEFPENFNYPYISTSIKEFWSRWHITLSRWFRDYVYIPLGGSRQGKIRAVLNLIIIWVLTGLWHGAGWNYVVWGIGYFVALSLERILLKYVKIPKIIGHTYTLIVTCTMQVVFHTLNLRKSMYYIQCMYGNAKMFDQSIKNLLLSAGIIPILAIIMCYPWKKVLKSIFLRVNLSTEKIRVLQSAIIFLLFIICASMCVTENYSPFIYFNF